MNECAKQKLLVEIAKLYYTNNFSQLEISKKLGLSRTYISKLLSEARQQGIVEIKIHDPLLAETGLESQLRLKYGLQKAIVISTSNADPTLFSKLGIAAAKYLNLIVQDGDVIGTAWGKTLHAFSQNIVKRDDMKAVQVVQLCGGITKLDDNVYAGEIPKNIAQALHGTHYLIPLPAVLDSVTAKNAVMTDKHILQVMALARKASIAIFTAGVFDKSNSFVKAGYFSDAEIAQLKQAGAVSDICSHIIDSTGKLCSQQLEQRTVALSLAEIAAIPTRMCIAAGTNKQQCLAAALHATHPSILVTNQQTAQYLLSISS